MLDILLLVLKIAGIIIASILGVLIVLIIIVLFIPIRYRIKAEKIDAGISDASININISYFLHLISIWLIYDKGVITRFKIFGIDILKFKNKNRKANTSNKKEILDGGSESIDNSKIAKDTNSGADYDIDWNEEEPVFNSAIEDENDSCTDELEKTEVKTEENVDDTDFLTDKISRFVSAIKNCYDNVVNFVNSSIRDVSVIQNKLNNKFESFNKKKNILFDVYNQEAIVDILNEVKYILRKLMPKKIKGFVEFGFDDPATTGQVLVILGILYPVLPQKVEIIPHMDCSVFNTRLDIKGSFCIVSAVIAAWKLFFNKKVKRFVKILRTKSN